MNSSLIATRSGPVLTIVLNNAERGNCLSPTLVESFHEALDMFEREGDGVLVVKGEGRNFCTGFDLSDLADLTDGDLMLRFVRIEQLLALLWSAPYPVIAVAQGRAMGAGADLFAACHRRIACDNATFCFPGASFGIVLGTRRLAVLTGADAARQLVMSGRVIDAAEARALGLVTACVPGGDLRAVVDTQLSEVTRLDPQTRDAIHAATGDGGAMLDADLAALVRSAARPGLRDRIIEYRSIAKVKISQPDSAKPKAR